MSTLTVYPDASSGATTVDGLVAYVSGAEANTEAGWDNMIAASGDFKRTDGYSSGLEVVYLFQGSGANWNILGRYIATLDTSALTSGATISAATFSIYGSAKLDPAANTPTVNVYGSTPNANNNLANGDYGQLGSTAYCDTALTYANQTTGAYNDFAFNATGIAAISLTGITKLGLRNANYDVASTKPTLSTNETSFEIRSADYTGTGSDPKLVITYSADITISAPLATINIAMPLPGITLNVQAPVGTINILAPVPVITITAGYTNVSKSSVSYTNTSKNSASWVNRTKRS